MHCLVTGAAGFIGSSIVDRLLAQGHTVVGVDCFVDYYPRAMKEANLVEAKKNKNFTFIEADIGAMDTDALLRGVEWIFHQAAQAGVRSSWGKEFDLYTRHNILVSQRLLESAKGSKTLKKFIYASSSSVYGDAETFPTREELTPKPLSPYGVSKLAAEHLMMLYAKEFAVPTVSLRYFTVYGPRQRPDMAFHRFIRAGLTGEQITIYGTGEQMRDFTFIDDIVTANINAAKSDTKGVIYNLGGGTNATVNSVLEILTQEIGTLNVKRVDRQVGDAWRTSADTTKAKKDLGFAPSVTLHEGLKAEIAWMKSILA